MSEVSIFRAVNCALFHVLILYWSITLESGNKKQALQSFVVLLCVSWSTRER